MLAQYLNPARTEKDIGFNISFNGNEIKLQTYRLEPIRLCFSLDFSVQKKVTSKANPNVMYLQFKTL